MGQWRMRPAKNACHLVTGPISISIPGDKTSADR